MKIVMVILMGVVLVSAWSYSKPTNALTTDSVASTVQPSPSTATPVAPKAVSPVASPAITPAAVTVASPTPILVKAPVKRSAAKNTPMHLLPAAPASDTSSSDTGVCLTPAQGGDYAIGVNDILTINVLQPEKIENNVTVSPDGNISFPYIGTVPVKGRSLSEVEQDIQIRLANGYLRYPLVVVYLKESRSHSFFVYGEVNRPGPYHLEDNTTVLRAISMAEGFTRFGSASRVKVLRARKGNAGYQTIPINIKALMDGNSDADLILKPGDMVVVSEGVF